MNFSFRIFWIICPVALVAATVGYSHLSSASLFGSREEKYDERIIDQFSGIEPKSVTTTYVPGKGGFRLTDRNHLEGLSGEPLDKISFILGSLANDLIASDSATIEIRKILQETTNPKAQTFKHTTDIEAIIYYSCDSKVFRKRIPESIIDEIAKFIDSAGYRLAMASEQMTMMKRLTKLSLFSEQCLKKFQYH
ncbi:hypothetical protein [Roseibium sp.]|uniref:hypothetical protein n=1 Tax=Roseibium sp. TaxID=1936156 RepID=UPI003919AAC4